MLEFVTKIAFLMMESLQRSFMMKMKSRQLPAKPNAAGVSFLSPIMRIKRRTTTAQLMGPKKEMSFRGVL